MNRTHDAYVLTSNIGDFFSEFIDGDLTHKHTNGFPPYNVYSTEKGYTFEVALAGWKKEWVDVYFKNNEMKIEGSAKLPNENNKKDYIVHKVAYRNFKLEFSFPKSDVDGENISASFKNGLLIIEVPYNSNSKEKQIKIL